MNAHNLKDNTLFGQRQLLLYDDVKFDDAICFDGKI